jgi:hypothetical protein
MRRLWPSCVVVVPVAMALWALPAAANPPDRDSFHVDDTAVESGICDFNVRFHFFGNVTVKNYVDQTGFLYRTIAHAGPGPFTVTASAKGTTLTQQNTSFTQVFTYNADGSIKTLTENGPFNKFTAPGHGIVLLDTGHIIFDGDFNIVFEAGPRQHGDFSAFCAAFG